ncbi:MAG: hypothetical protein GC185_08710 [Alphaproteobacteria bacterium]|nr:hypothetical protein [Alphaproteobacteria bacterium]
MNVKFVDGLVESLKGHAPLPEDEGNPIYKLLQDKELRGNTIGQLVGALHEHRPMEKDSLGEEKLSAQKDTRILYDATENRVTFAVVGREPKADGTYNAYANVTLQRGDDKQWHVDSFFTSLDPTGFEKEEAERYVDIGEGVSTAYGKNDQKFVADFLQSMTKGEDMWGALTDADHMGRMDTVFAGARKQEQARLAAGEKPIALFKIKDGHFPGRFDYDASGETREERRVSVAPVMARKDR